jgi:hypothetical protein
VNEELKAAVETVATGAGVGTVGGVARMIFFGQEGSFLAHLSVTGMAAFIGILAGLLASSFAVSEKVQWAIILMAGFTARDLLTGLRAMGAEFAADPLALVMRVWRAIKGQ